VTARLGSSTKTCFLRMCAGGVVLACAFFVAGCEQEQHRTFYDFMDDSLAREGVLARCNQNRESNRDPECAEARRAAAAVAAESERERLAALEQESQRKILAMRDRLAADERAAERAVEEVEAALQAAYDAQWQEPSLAQESPPVLADGERDDVLSAFVPTRLPLEVAAVTPPANDFEIDEPQVELAIIPRPFRHDDTLPH
jgi:hypothetical protein